MSEIVQLSFISRDETDLIPIGRVTAVEGRARRKLVNDVLWFPMTMNETVFLGDSIETGKDSSSQIELSDPVKGNLRINSKTVVKMRAFMKKPMIVLVEGEVDLSGDAPEGVFINSGLKTERVQIRKDSVTKVRRTEDGDLGLKTLRVDSKSSSNMAAAERSGEIKVGAVEENQGFSNGIPRPLKYPYPADQTAFLVASAGRLTLFPKKKCESSCRLHVNTLSGDEVLSQEFKADDDVLGLIPYGKKTVGDYRWVLDDGGHSLTGVFFIRPYSPEEMKQQVRFNRPIEILTDL